MQASVRNSRMPLDMTERRPPEAHTDAPSQEALVEWHALAPDDALGDLATSRFGLSSDEAARRLELHGPNILPVAKGRSLLVRVVSQFNNVLIYALLAASIVTALLGHFTDTGVILAVVLVNAAIGFWQEGKAENALAAVRGMLSPHASLLRDGTRVIKDAADVVLGDIVLIEAGDRVPADMRLIEARGLRIDEAALTGESVPSDKDVAPVTGAVPLGDRTSMAYSGTMVTAGRGTGVAVLTGSDTEIGRIGAMLGGIEEIKTPLLAQIDRFAKALTGVILLICVLVFATAVWLRGYAVDDAFLAVVGMAVAGIPEGLPAVITITLAIGVQRMAARRTIVRRLPAIETLGAVSTICTDKTGTLTLNEMAVRSLVPEAAATPWQVTGEGYAPEGEIIAADEAMMNSSEALVRTGLLCSDASLAQSENGLWTVVGDPMDGALVALAHKAGLDHDAVRAQHERLSDLPFDSAQRYAATLNALPAGGAEIHIKGATERIIELCEHEIGPEGRRPLDRERWKEQEDALARSGQRVLAFAYRAADGERELDPTAIQHGFTMLGLAGFVDPPRPEAIAAIAECHKAEVKVKMITGDHAVTAMAIGAELGLDTLSGALTGADIDSMDDPALAEHVHHIDIFARAAPEHKLRLVSALQSGGNVVSMTGDGANDAPALKRADVGVAMGIKGTEAAKEAAKVVLTDDNFATIAEAVREGRTITDNIRKVIAWTLPTNGGESLIIIGAILLGLALPIMPVQILWINMITAVALGLTLAFDPPAADVMRRPPRAIDAPLIDGTTLWRVVLVSALMAISVFSIYAWSVSRGDELAYARTLCVNAVVAIEIAYLFVVRHGRGSGLKGWLGTRAVWVGVGATLVAQVCFTYAAPLQSVFDTRALAPSDLGVLVLLAVALVVVLELEQILRTGLTGRRRTLENGHGAHGSA